MKINIIVDEVYPIYKVEECCEMGDEPFNVSKETLKRWKKVCDEFVKVQEEMMKAAGEDEGACSDYFNLDI